MFKTKKEFENTKKETILERPSKVPETSLAIELPETVLKDLKDEIKKRGKMKKEKTNKEVSWLRPLNAPPSIVSMELYERTLCVITV